MKPILFCFLKIEKKKNVIDDNYTLVIKFIVNLTVNYFISYKEQKTSNIMP